MGDSTSARRMKYRPASGTDTVATLYAHLVTGSWSAVIAHTWRFLDAIAAAGVAASLAPDDDQDIRNVDRRR